MEWDAEGKHYKQTISTNPPSREDVNTLQKLLDEKLVVRQARYCNCNPGIRESAQLERNCTSNASMRSFARSPSTLQSEEFSSCESEMNST
jgi:hypothetical protein